MAAVELDLPPAPNAPQPDGHAADRPLRLPPSAAHLSPDDIEAIGRELDAIRQRHLDDRGDADRAYIHRIVRLQRNAELAGRALLTFAWFPPAFLAGAASLGAAKILSENRSEIAGRVRFMFQPGEEGFGGAKVMIDEGVLDGVDRAFAIHVTPNIPTGYIASRPGPMLASADTFEVVVRGEGGHASSPHFCVDPVPGACAIVPALQTMITRELNAFDPALLTVTQINAGTTTNVIAETATLAGTIRAVSEANRARIHDSIHRVATTTSAAHNCTAEVTVSPGYPVTVNHASEIQ